MEQPNPQDSSISHSSQNPPTTNKENEFNSSVSHSSQNPPTPNKENEFRTSDGWTVKEDDIFEKLWCDFDGVASPAFFQQIAHELPWKSMNAIKIHYECYMRELDLINPFHGDAE